MKKTLLLSVVASSMIMAGGDIAPVEPVAAPIEASAWEFGGQVVAYYQTDDAAPQSVSGMTEGDLFDQEASAADAGIQLRATNNDVFAGIGAGVAVNGLTTLNLENSVVSHVMQTTGNAGDLDDLTDGGWISEAYLTYGFGNTGIKAGRQTLPKSLSPFAYSEHWNVFANTFDAVTIVNTDITNTTIVGGWIAGNNVNGMHANMTDFNSLNDDDGVFMLTAQNKSIENLTLTGSVYYGADMGANDDLFIWWGDAAYDAGNFGVAIQGGMEDANWADDMTAFGAKLTGSFSGINLMAAYSTVSDGAMAQLGGETSALYTTTIYDQINYGTLGNWNEDKIVVGANVAALGGIFAAAYADSSNDDADYSELDVSYTTRVFDSLDLTAAYVNIDSDSYMLPENLVRLVASYNF